MKQLFSASFQKRTYSIANTIGFVSLWLFFFFAMRHTLVFWEKNLLFRYSTEYFRYFDHDPLGVLSYLNSFFVQFNYHIWLGAAVYAGLFWLVAFMLNRILFYAGQIRVSAPGWIVSGLLLPTAAFYGLLWVLILLLILTGTWLWLPRTKPTARYICQAVVTAALMWMIREYTLFACLFYIGIDMLAIRRQGKKIRHYTFWPCWTGVLLCFCVGWKMWLPYEFVNFHVFFILNYAPAKMMLPPFTYFHATLPTLICLGICMILFSGAGLFYPLFTRPDRKNHSCLINLGASLVLLAMGAGIGFRQSRPMREFQKVDTLCREYRWEEALKQLNRQWDRNPDMSGSAYTKSLFSAQTKIALLATRKATDRLFTYPQPAFPMLFPLELTNHAESFVIPLYYLYSGGFAETLHVNYDFVTSHCISPNTLRGIIIASLILEDTMPVSKMVHFFEKTLFYRQEAKLYRDADRRNALPAVVRGKTMLPPEDYTVKTYKPDENAIGQHRNDPENPFFYEYYLCVRLLKKQHHLIPAEMPAIRKFYQRGPYTVIPRHIQEALLANFDYIPMRLAYPEHIEGVDPETWRDYWQFLVDNQNYQNKNISFKQLQKKWAHTYWFYDYYLSCIELGNNSTMPIN